MRPDDIPRKYRFMVRMSRQHRAEARKKAAEAKRLLPLFEKKYPKDSRPRKAIEAIAAWGAGKRELGMAEVRKLSLDAHAAARAAKTDAARFAARAAGQAVAIWHVPTHALGVPYYAGKAAAAIQKEGSRPQMQKAKKKLIAMKVRMLKGDA